MPVPPTDIASDECLARPRRALFATTIPVTLEAFLLPFADSLREKGWHVDALANGASTAEGLRGRFDKVFDIAWTRDPRSLRHLPRLARQVRRIVSEDGYDVVHVHTPIAAFATRFALRRLRRRGGPAVIYTAHGFHFYRGQPERPHRVFRAMERIAARWTDDIITLNAEDYSAALELGTIARDRVHLIHGIGVDCSLFRPQQATPETVRLRALFDVPEDHLMLTMVAEMNINKRHGFALEVARVLHHRHAPVTIVFVGTGPLEGRLREQVREQGLSDVVQFAGVRHDMPEVLAATDLLMLVSEREGLPRSILEALACGTPAVGTATRGITDAIGDDSLIAPKNDPVALAEIVISLAEDRDRLRSLGRAARSRAEHTFALPRIIKSVEDVYCRVLSDRGRRTGHA